MKPSSSIWLASIVVAASLQPTNGEAASHGVARGFFHARPQAHAMHNLYRNAIEHHHRHHRLASGTFFWPYAWSGVVANEDANPTPDDNGVDNRVPWLGPVLYAPPPVPPPCSRARIIDIAAAKRDANLPRVVYGTPSLCPN